MSLQQIKRVVYDVLNVFNHACQIQTSIRMDGSGVPPSCMQFLKHKSTFIPDFVFYPDVTCTVSLGFMAGVTKVNITIVITQSCVHVDYVELCTIIRTYVAILTQIRRPRESVDIVIMPLKHKKVLDTRKKTALGCAHVNGGVTDKASQLIFVYRYEEMYKVLLHELIHLYKFDDTRIPQDVTSSIIHAFNIHTPRLGLNEVHTDTLAFTILAGVQAFTQHQHPPSYDRYSSSYDDELLSLICHAHSRARVVMAYYNRWFAGEIVEESHAFSYYIAKYMILSSLPEYLQIVGKSLAITSPEKYRAIAKLLISRRHVFDSLQTPKETPLKMIESLRMSNLDMSLWKKLKHKTLKNNHTTTYKQQAHLPPTQIHHNGEGNPR